VSTEIRLSAVRRERPGKGEAGRLRREGRVPAALYGVGVAPSAVSVDARELLRAIRGPSGTNALVALEVDGAAPVLTVLRDLQRHPVKGAILHLDFVAVDTGVTIEVEVPVHLVDQDRVARDGGFLNHVRHVVPIRVRPLDTPDFLELSVAGMAIGDVKRLGDLVALLPAGAELADDPDRVVVTVNAPGGGEAAPSGEGAAAPAAEGAAGAGGAPAA
jgi:large subunit ribosomal protein L25